MTKLTQMTLDNDGGGEDGDPSRRRIHLREISGDNESPLETVGQDLRAARLRRGDEIAHGFARAQDPQGPSGGAGGGPAGRSARQDLCHRLCAFLCPLSRPGRDRHVSSASSAEISGRADDKVHEPAPIHQDDGRRLPQGWRIIAGAVVILLGWGAWHLLSSSARFQSACAAARRC